MTRPRHDDPTLPGNRLERNRELARRRMARARNADMVPRVEMIWRKVAALPANGRAEIARRLAELLTS